MKNQLKFQIRKSKRVKNNQCDKPFTQILSLTLNLKI